jgi:hypothetical protein
VNSPALSERLEAFAFAAETGILDEARSSVGDALDNLRGLRERILATIEHHKSRVAKHEGERSECDRSIAAFELAAAKLKDTDNPRLELAPKAKAEPVREAATYSGPGEVPKPADAPPVEDDPAFDEIEDEELDEVA